MFCFAGVTRSLTTTSNCAGAPLCPPASGVIFLGFLKALWVLCVTRSRHAATATPRFTDKQKITVGFLITDGAFKKRSVIAIKD